MIEKTAQESLSQWSISPKAVRLAAQRENIVFRVETHKAGPYALRLHRPGYQSAQMVRSELAWMAHLQARDFHVPRPLPSASGDMLVQIVPYHADLLTWLEGAPMGATAAPLVSADRGGLFMRLGALMAKLHDVSDAWDPPPDFERRRWDIDGLLGDDPHWGPFWQNPGLTADGRDIVLRARAGLKQDLTTHAGDFGLIHADMVRENVIVRGDRIGLIDFDDSGFGFRLFDVATTLLKNQGEPDYPELEAAFLRGYRAVRPLDTQLLPQFLLTRALSYLGWIIPRLGEPGAETRQKRFLATTLPMVEAYLQNAPRRRA
ncbi:MAG: homoserine kinase [Pseudomonadota bacterium]